MHFIGTSFIFLLLLCSVISTNGKILLRVRPHSIRGKIAKERSDYAYPRVLTPHVEENRLQENTRPTLERRAVRALDDANPHVEYETKGMTQGQMIGIGVGFGAGGAFCIMTLVAVWERRHAKKTRRAAKLSDTESAQRRHHLQAIASSLKEAEKHNAEGSDGPMQGILLIPTPRKDLELLSTESGIKSHSSGTKGVGTPISSSGCVTTPRGHVGLRETVVVPYVFTTSPTTSKRQTTPTARENLVAYVTTSAEMISPRLLEVSGTTLAGCEIPSETPAPGGLHLTMATADRECSSVAPIEKLHSGDATSGCARPLCIDGKLDLKSNQPKSTTNESLVPVRTTATQEPQAEMTHLLRLPIRRAGESTPRTTQLSYDDQIRSTTSPWASSPGQRESSAKAPRRGVLRQPTRTCQSSDMVGAGREGQDYSSRCFSDDATTRNEAETLEEARIVQLDGKSTKISSPMLTGGRESTLRLTDEAASSKVATIYVSSEVESNTRPGVSTSKVSASPLEKKSWTASPSYHRKSATSPARSLTRIPLRELVANNQATPTAREEALVSYRARLTSEALKESRVEALANYVKNVTLSSGK